MSFAVFGVTMDYCLQMARKKVSQYKGSKADYKQKTLAEWETEVSEKAQELYYLYAAGKRALPKLSADLSQPAACRDFIRLAQKQNAEDRFVIKQKRPVIQANGQPMLDKKKQPVLRYQNYPGTVEGAAA